MRCQSLECNAVVVILRHLLLPSGYKRRVHGIPVWLLVSVVVFNYTSCPCPSYKTLKNFPRGEGGKSQYVRTDTLAESNRKTVVEPSVMEALKLSDYMGSTIHVTLKNNSSQPVDQRLLTGVLIATDCQLNILLDEVQEESTSTPDKGRKLGLVSVPNNTIERICITKPQLDKLCKWKEKSMRDIV